MFIDKPILVEPGASFFFSQSLHNCHEVKKSYMNKLINVGLFVLFVIIITVILLSMYKGKPTLYEKNEKTEKERLYILNQIKTMQLDKQRERNQLITNLPGPGISVDRHYYENPKTFR